MQDVRGPAAYNRVGDITRDGWQQRSLRRTFSRYERRLIKSLFGHPEVVRILIHGDVLMAVVDGESNRVLIKPKYREHTNVSFIVKKNRV